jgi:hypothetical protein
MKAIKIENRTWRCARAHISSNNRHKDKGKESFNIRCIAGQTAEIALLSATIRKNDEQYKLKPNDTFCHVLLTFWQASRLRHWKPCEKIRALLSRPDAREAGPRLHITT